MAFRIGWVKAIPARMVEMAKIAGIRPNDDDLLCLTL